MKRVRIGFEDIKAGDLLEVVIMDNGVKSVLTGIAFAKETLSEGFNHVHTWWKTSEGGMIVAKEESVTIYRIDVAEVKFDDIQKGDRVRVTEKAGNRVTTEEATAVLKIDGGFNPYWLDSTGEVVLFRLSTPNAERTIEILERGE